MDWIECTSCWAEFKVVSDVIEPAQFCPYCGADIEIEQDDEDEDDDEY